MAIRNGSNTRSAIASNIYPNGETHSLCTDSVLCFRRIGDYVRHRVGVVKMKDKIAWKPRKMSAPDAPATDIAGRSRAQPR